VNFAYLNAITAGQNDLTGLSRTGRLPGRAADGEREIGQ
jgi:hypothetical protein